MAAVGLMNCPPYQKCTLQCRNKVCVHIHVHGLHVCTVHVPSVLSWSETQTNSPHPRTQQMERNTDSPNHNLSLEVMGSSSVGMYTVSSCEDV